MFEIINIDCLKLFKEQHAYNTYCGQSREKETEGKVDSRVLEAVGWLFCRVVRIFIAFFRWESDRVQYYPHLQAFCQLKDKLVCIFTTAGKVTILLAVSESADELEQEDI